MPGILGVVGESAGRTSVASGAKAISHFDEYVGRESSPFNGIEIAQVWRNSSETKGSWDRNADSGTCIYVNGSVLLSGAAPRRIFAGELLNAYLAGRLDPQDYDGSFVIVVADAKANQLIIMNDRLGSLPVYYFAGSGCFCFAPEAKGIFSTLSRKPEFSENGLISFLALGYCLADTTLFSSIRFLEPANRLTVDVRSGSCKNTRYWHFAFEPAKEFRSRRTSEEALHQAIIGGHRTVCQNPDESYDLLLSGGWDSRGILAAAHKLEQMPRRTVTWGLRDDIPLTDASLAAQLAKQYGTDHHFIPYDTNTFVENAADWSFLTELCTDNFGWYAEGTNVLLNDYVGNADFIVVGDECWGLGGHVRNKIEVMAANLMPAPNSEALASIINDKTIGNWRQIYVNEVDKVLRHCSNSEQNDRKDFLYLHGRLARFIFALGYYKKLAVEVRRPFLTSEVLSVVQQLPIRLRYRKNVYISTLIRFFPDLLRVHKRAGNSLPQWRYDLRHRAELSEYFADLLSNTSLSKSSFGQYLDLKGIEVATKDFFSRVQNKSAGTLDKSAKMGRIGQSLKQRAVAFEDVRLGLRLKDPPYRKLDTYDLLRRVALLTLLDRNLPRLSMP